MGAPSSELTLEPQIRVSTARVAVETLSKKLNGSGVAFANVTAGASADKLDLNLIKLITDWGDGIIREKIPSVISYTRGARGSSKTFYSRWGVVPPGSYAAVNQKLMLEIDGRDEELDLLRTTFKGMRYFSQRYLSETNAKPYPSIGPEEIITDYLKYIFKHTQDQLKEWHPNEEVRRRFPVDTVVATIPTVSTLVHFKIWQSSVKKLIDGLDLGTPRQKLYLPSSNKSRLQ